MEKLIRVCPRCLGKKKIQLDFIEKKCALCVGEGKIDFEALTFEGLVAFELYNRIIKIEERLDVIGNKKSL